MSSGHSVKQGEAGVLVQAAGKKWIVRLMLLCYSRLLDNSTSCKPSSYSPSERGRVHESHTRDLVASTELQWVIVLDGPVMDQ